MRQFLLGGLCVLAPALGWADPIPPGEDLDEAIEKTAKLDSYTFEAAFESDTDLDDLKAEGRWLRRRGLAVSIGDYDLMLMGGRTLFRKDGGAWTSGEPEALPRIVPPHEEVRKLTPAVEHLEKTDETERFRSEIATLHKGTLTVKGARDLLVFKELTQDHPEAEVTGRIRVWISESGLILKYVVEITIRDQDDFEARVFQTVELGDINDVAIVRETAGLM